MQEENTSLAHIVNSSIKEGDLKDKMSVRKRFINSMSSIIRKLLFGLIIENLGITNPCQCLFSVYIVIIMVM